MEQTATIKLRALDHSGQKHATVNEVPVNITVGQLVQGLLPRMELQEKDAAGEDLFYQARLEREGRNLNKTELVNDVLREDDEIRLLPDVSAGVVPDTPLRSAVGDGDRMEYRFCFTNPPNCS